MRTKPALRKTNNLAGLSTYLSLLSTILDSTSQAIIVLDKAGCILLTNKSAIEMFGYKAEKLAGKNIQFLIPEKAGVSAKKRGAGCGEPSSAGVDISGDLSARRCDGAAFPVEVSLRHLESEVGPLAILFISDLTARRQLEQQLLQARKMEAVGRLAGGIAHDFNNLLTIICGYNGLLLDTLPQFDPTRTYVEEAQKAAERAAALTGQLLAFSRRQTIEPKIINLNSVILEAEQMIRRVIGENIELQVTRQADLGNVRADAGQIGQVILNMVANARDAMPTGGRLTIKTANVVVGAKHAAVHQPLQPGRYVMMTVSDNGIGMDAETRKNALEPFFTTKGPGQGTGLGLATVHEIVKQSGGGISISSEVQKGTTFELYFPRLDAAADDDSSIALEPVKDGHETVLVVEDEACVRHLIVQVLRRGGYQVLEAGDALEAAHIGDQHNGPIDLVIADVVMPHATGLQIMQDLAVSRPGIRVLYVSGYTDKTIGQQGIDTSEANFLAKPFSFDVLLAKVRDILAPAQAACGQVG